MVNFDFIKNAITTSVNKLANRFMFYSGRYLNKKSFPVYIRSTGDKVYMSIDEGVNEEKEYVLERVPRCVVSIGTIAFPESKRSLGRQDSVYKIEVLGVAGKKNRPMKTVGYRFGLKLRITMPDFVHTMQFIQYLQEAFVNPNIPFRFQSDGMENEGIMFVDVTEPNFDLKIGDGDDYEDMYPWVEIDVTLIGNYANFGFYDLATGGHGYNGYNNDAINDFIDNGDGDADKPVTKVTTNTNVTDPEGNTGTDTWSVTEDE
jgi:hypothetical protein